MKCFLIVPTEESRSVLGRGTSAEPIVKVLFERIDTKQKRWCNEFAPGLEFGPGAMFYSDKACTSTYGEYLWILLPNGRHFCIDQQGYTRVGEPPCITVSKNLMLWTLENGELIEAA